MFYSGVLYTVTIVQNVLIRHFYIFLNISFYICINIQMNGWLDPFGCLLVLHIQHKIHFLKHLIMPQSFKHIVCFPQFSINSTFFKRSICLIILEAAPREQVGRVFPHMYCCSINTRGQYFTPVSL